MTPATPTPKENGGAKEDKLRTSHSDYYNYYYNKHGPAYWNQHQPPNFPVKPYKNVYDYTDGSMPDRQGAYGSNQPSGYGGGQAVGYDRDDYWGGDDYSCGGGGGGGYGGMLSGNSAIYLFTAGAFVTFILYRAIKDFETAAGGRKVNFFFEDIVHGLEEFEEKIDRIADGKDTGDDSWISRIYNQFVGEYGEVDNELKDSDMDGLEPPLLDEKWGLSAADNNNTTDDSNIADENTSRKKKRDVDDNEIADDDVPLELTKGEEKCRVDMWRCLSKVVEGSLHYMDNTDGLMGLAKKTMFKMAFHGGFSNIWSGVMSIPEARSVKRCMNTHEECVAYEVLNREVSDSLDPQDPEFNQVQDKMQDLASEGSTKKRRIMVNPEFVQSLDQSDGSEAYDYPVNEEDY